MSATMPPLPPRGDHPPTAPIAAHHPHRRGISPRCGLPGRGGAFNLLEAVRIIEQEYDRILGHGILPLTLGGDHTITLPILRAIKKKHGKVGLVHVDAHADVNDHMFGEKIAHGTTFRRAVEEDLLDCDRVVQIGLRAQGYTASAMTKLSPP